MSEPKMFVEIYRAHPDDEHEQVSWGEKTIFGDKQMGIVEKFEQAEKDIAQYLHGYEWSEQLHKEHKDRLEMLHKMWGK